MWYLIDAEKRVIVGVPGRSRRTAKKKLKKKEHCYGMERNEEKERDKG
jgi:hypothetical protein